jgi:hypothetical protein
MYHLKIPPMYNNLKHLSLFIVLFLFINSCTGKKIITLEPVGYRQLNNALIENGDLKALFIDNTDLPPDHKAGYNGIAELYHTDQDSTLFVPAYAGFNLEHIFCGDSLVQFFEPRVNPMYLYKKSETEVLIYQKATPVSGAESLTEFKLVAPCYIDITFNCIFHNKEYFRHGYAGFFWASYINNPVDRNMYFRGVTEGQSSDDWISAFSEGHGLKSTHRNFNDKHDFYFAPEFKAVLVNSYSDFRYTYPFYFGRFHNMVMAYLFDSEEVIRFSQSPNGGGNTNPAWDFQYIIADPDTAKKYTFKARMIYKPFVSYEDIREEYEKWIKNK